MAERGRSGGLLSRLARLIGRDRAEAREAPQAGPEDVSPIVDEAFTWAIEQLLSEDEARFQTKLQVVSLVEFHEAVGPQKWVKLSEKVLLIAEGVINQHIGPGNLYSRRGQDMFVLLFRNIPQEEGRRRAIIIANELGTRLVGAQFTGSEVPLALAAEIDLDTALNETGEIDLGALHGAVGQVRAIMAPTGDRSGARPHRTRVIEDGHGELRAHMKPSRLGTPEDGPPELRAHMKPSDPAAMSAALAAQQAQATRNTPRPVAVTGAEPNMPRTVSAPAWVSMEMGGGQRPDPALGPESCPPMPGNAVLSLSWRPNWVANNETIGAYRAVVSRLDISGETPWTGARAYPQDHEASILELDRFAAGAAMRALKIASVIEGGAQIWLPMHWSSVASAQRLSVLGALGMVPEDLRTQRLVLDLFGVPADLPRDLLAAQVEALAPHCRAVAIRVPLSGEGMEMVAEAGAAFTGFDLGSLAPGRHPGDDELLKTMKSLAGRAAGLGLHAYAGGLRRRPGITGAVLAGFAMVDGPGLMKDIPQPSKILPAPRARLVGGS